MTDRNGNLNENSRSGSQEHGREPVRRKTAMNSREIVLEDEDFLDEPEDGYLDDDYLEDDYPEEDAHSEKDYFDRDMEERILREAEQDMEAMHQPEQESHHRRKEPEKPVVEERGEAAGRRRSRARGSKNAGGERETLRTAPQRKEGSGSGVQNRRNRVKRQR